MKLDRESWLLKQVTIKGSASNRETRWGKKLPLPTQQAEKKSDEEATPMTLVGQFFRLSTFGFSNVLRVSFLSQHFEAKKG
jgi:hypothetical protein